MRRGLFTHSGMTLIDVVLALLVLIMLQPILLSSLTFASRTDFQWNYRQNQLGILQLRRKIALGVDLLLNSSSLSLTINDQRLTFVCQDGLLNQQPGSMPFLYGLDSCSWIRRGQLIILSFSEGEVSHELIVGMWT